MYYHPKSFLLLLCSHLSHLPQPPNYVVFEMSLYLAILLSPMCRHTDSLGAQTMDALLIIISPANWWNTGKQELLNKYLLYEWITSLSLYSWCSDTEAFILWALWWLMPRQKRALGAGVSGSISQRKKIALSLWWWKGLVEEGRANGLSTGQEAIWERWESMEWIGGNVATDMTDKWQGLGSLEL